MSLEERNGDMDSHPDDLPNVPREILQWISAEYHGEIYCRNLGEYEVQLSLRAQWRSL